MTPGQHLPKSPQGMIAPGLALVSPDPHRGILIAILMGGQPLSARWIEALPDRVEARP
jgi:hypothetical protein